MQQLNCDHVDDHFFFVCVCKPPLSLRSLDARVLPQIHYFCQRTFLSHLRYAITITLENRHCCFSSFESLVPRLTRKLKISRWGPSLLKSFFFLSTCGDRSPSSFFIYTHHPQSPLLYFQSLGRIWDRWLARKYITTIIRRFFQPLVVTAIVTHTFLSDSWRSV